MGENSRKEGCRCSADQASAMDCGCCTQRDENREPPLLEKIEKTMAALGEVDADKLLEAFDEIINSDK